MERKPIILTTVQRKELEQFTETGVHSARLMKRARVILSLDTSEGRKAATFAQIGSQEKISNTAITNIKNSFFSAESISAFLQRKQRVTPPVAPKITGEVEARIIALACSKVPEGCARWTVRLIAEKSIEVNLGEAISKSSVHSILKKHNLSLT